MTFPFVLSEGIYNKLKWFVLIVLPAVSALYFGLSQIYNWSNGEAVVGTISLVMVFLGSLLGISTRQYYKNDLADGQIVVVADDEFSEPSQMTLLLEKTPEELSKMGRVSFRVQRETASNWPPPLVD